MNFNISKGAIQTSITLAYSVSPFFSKKRSLCDETQGVNRNILSIGDQQTKTSLKSLEN